MTCYADQKAAYFIAFLANKHLYARSVLAVVMGTTACFIWG